MFVMAWRQIFCAAAIWAAPASGWTADKPEPAEIREFEILVDDKPVGTHIMRIRDQGDRSAVTLTSDVEVKVLFYRYRYHFHAREQWDNNRLTSFHALTNDNGKKVRVQWKRDSDNSVLLVQDRLAEIKPPHQTTSYSRLPSGADETRQLRLLKLDDGEEIATTWTPAEESEWRIGDRAIRCRKWVVEGDVEAELWFDAAGWLVRQQTVERGHQSELRLTSIELETAK
jgi:hypothetical protein